MTERPIAWLIVIALAGTPSVVLSQSDPAATDGTQQPAATQSDLTPEQARQILDDTRPRAEAGDAAAQYNMGVLYDRGIGVSQNYETAHQWYEKAAAQRYGRAEHNLGIMYESGKGVTASPSRAARWFRRGADDGEAASQNNLGVLYMQGKGVPQNTGKAAFWTARAAASGNGAAIDNLPRIVEDLPRAHVNADDVNVRDQPDGQARVVRQADEDASVAVLAREPDWTQVLFPETYEIGWIANALVSDNAVPLADAANVPRTAAANDEAPPTSSQDTAPVSTPDVVDQATSSQNTDATSRPGPVDSPTPVEQPATPTPPVAAEPEASSSPQRAAASDNADASGSTPLVTQQGSPSDTDTAASTLPDSVTAGPATDTESGGLSPGDEAPVATTDTASTAGAEETADADEASSAADQPADTQRRRVGVGTLNLRARPSRASQVIGQLNRNDVVTVTETENGWARVQTEDGQDAWAAGYLLLDE